LKNIENLRKISDLLEITEIYKFDEFKREYLDLDDKEEKDYFDQILIVSNDEIQNTVIKLILKKQKTRHYSGFYKNIYSKSLILE